MIQLRGGPAAGAYAVQRAPFWLRAVVDRGSGATDVLNELDDAPKPTEAVSIYVKIADEGMVHANRGGRRSGFYAVATYDHVSDVDGEGLREQATWRDWVAARIRQAGGEIDMETGELIHDGGDGRG